MLLDCCVRRVFHVDWLKNDTCPQLWKKDWGIKKERTVVLHSYF